MPDLNLAAIPLEVVTLCSYTPLPALLPRLERCLEVLFFKRVKHHLRCELDLLHNIKTATLQLELHLGEEEKFTGSQIWRVWWVRSDDCVGAAKKLVFSTHCELARCHDGAPNCHHATVQVVCAECLPSDA